MSQIPAETVTRYGAGRGLRDHAPGALDRDQRLLARGLGQDPGELVAADPSKRVLGARQLRQDARDTNEHLISGVVPAAVVDLLEVIDVDHRHRERRVVTQRAGDLGGQPLLQRAVVGKRR